MPKKKHLPENTGKYQKQPILIYIFVLEWHIDFKTFLYSRSYLNNLKLPEIAENDRKLPKMAINCRKWPEIAKNGKNVPFHHY